MGSPSSPLPRGAIALGRYSVRRKLGSGSLGTVYLVRDARARRLVALKLIRVDRLTPGAVERLQEEFRAIASLRHPRIASAHDFGYSDAGALPYYTREYVEGSPIAPGPPGSAPPTEFLRPVLHLLEALEYLHGHGILHLDIHPGNLIVADDPARGSVLIDFGFLGAFEGTPLSMGEGPWSDMPPEMLRRERLGPATDLFLAGRLLEYRLTGQTGGDVKLPREVPGWGPRRTLELERIVSKAIDPDPGRRFQSAAEFRDALARALGDEGRPQPAEEPRDVFAGREAEMREIGGLLDRAASGRTGVLWLTGPAGIGKTRLLAEAKVRAQLRGLDVAAVRFFPDPGSASSLLRALAAHRLPPARGGPARSERWSDALAARHGGTPAERARRAARAWLHEARRPAVLLLDDLDLADRESRWLAEALIIEAVERRDDPPAAGRGLAIVATGAVAEGRPKGLSARALRPLSRRESEALFRALIHPLGAGRSFARLACAGARGSPLRLRRIAMAVRAEWGRSGAVPPGARAPAAIEEAGGPRGASRAGLGRLDQRVLAALSVIRRPAMPDEVAAALRADPRAVLSSLRRLERAELAASFRRGRSSFFRLEPRALAQGSRGEWEVPPREARRIHGRLAALLRREGRTDLEGRESLARHVLGAGKGVRGARLVLDVASALRRAGELERAARLLEEARSRDLPLQLDVHLAEEASSIAEETGDHERGIAIIEPVIARAGGELPALAGTRLRRRLGVHYHRAGRVADALRAFEEALAIAGPARHLEEIIFIDSELAEIHTLRGDYARAEESCRRGLERLSSLGKGHALRDPMETTLRASLGHLELRRMNLERAAAELKAASRLARRSGSPAVEAVILNNLGIAENQLHRLGEAVRCFRRAEKLHAAAGERRAVITIASNLAAIAAKRGNAADAAFHLERAGRLLLRHPARRLEFFLEYTRGVVAHLLGDAAGAIDALSRALKLGRQAGDLHLVRFGEVHLAEALLATARYRQALALLRRAASDADRLGFPHLRRVVHSRLHFAEAIAGTARRAARSRRAIEESPRSGVVLLDAWNDLFAACARLFLGEAARDQLEAAREAFRRLKAPAGERFAALGLLADAIARGDRGRIEGLLRQPPSAAAQADHRFLAVAEPLARAEACLFLGDIEQAKERLCEATSAIVNAPFPELDWRLELVRGLAALKAGDPAAARGHIHRSSHTRDLLLELVPAGARARFLAHPRFALLASALSRLERSPRLFFTTRRMRRGGPFEGLVGESQAMLRVFQAIEGLRGSELPVLIAGETGTGKELVARALHRTSPRGEGPFLALHGASIPQELFESELFGYEAGAFTGAEESRPGLLESVHGGSLLLDEVSDLPPPAQAKLLRVIDARAARRLGGTAERTIDVRFLSATSADLAGLAAKGGFRRDLYHRLAAVEIRLPPLRERREDVPLLARHLLAEHARRIDRAAPALAAGALRLLERHDWPGNVRELEAVLLRAVLARSPGEEIGARDIEPLLRPREARRLFDEEALEGRTLGDLRAELERTYLTRLFRTSGGDLEKMMAALGVKRSYLYTWMGKLGIDIRELRRRLGR
jgi:DNA-binding NtrC family response regulator/tetratricopeptide (TPR) repeat protein